MQEANNDKAFLATEPLGRLLLRLALPISTGIVMT